METRSSARHDEPSAPIRLDEDHWTDLVERYQPLIDSVCRRFRLRPEDAADVSQNVWLRLYANKDSIRELKALPGWIKTTTERAAIEALRHGNRSIPVADSAGAERLESSVLTSSYDDEVDTHLLREEQNRAVRQGLATLPQRNRTLLCLLVADPPVSYRKIGAQLGMPVGSIGPTRARYLDKLAASAPVRALVEAVA